MPQRRNSLTAALGIRRGRSADSARAQAHPMLALDIPALDRALKGGLPLNRVTEIVGAGPGKTLLAAVAVASLQSQVPAAEALWLDLDNRLDHELLVAAGVDDARLRIVQPPAAAALKEIEGALGDKVYAIVLSGLPIYRRGDHLYAAILQQLAMTAPWTRAVILILNAPGGDKGPLDRLAAVRLALSRERAEVDAYAATATIIKNRFGNGGIAVPLTIKLK